MEIGMANMTKIPPINQAGDRRRRVRKAETVQADSINCYLDTSLAFPNERTPILEPVVLKALRRKD
jgi:hypothetical protein